MTDGQGGRDGGREGDTEWEESGEEGWGVVRNILTGCH